MHAVFVAVASSVMVVLIEAQMDRRRQPDGDGVRTRAQRRREEEEERRRREEEEGTVSPEEEDRRRREQEERRRREEENGRAIAEMRRRLRELPTDSHRLAALTALEPNFPEPLRHEIRERIEELQQRIQGTRLLRPEE